MKIFLAGLATESNLYSPFPTSSHHFEAEGIFHGNGRDLDEEKDELTNQFFLKARQNAKALGWEVAFSFCGGAEPAGPTVKEVYETYRDEILADLRRVMPVNVVMLGLHGAMIAYDYNDCEGDLLTAIREITGPDTVIGALLDPHCHFTKKMADAADILICFKEYPHTDVFDRGEDLFELLTDAAHGKIDPVKSVYDCRMISMYYTDMEPMKTFVAEMKAAETQEGVLSVSLVHGFPWADIPEMGTKILVITDNKKGTGDQLARQFGQELFSLRGQTFIPALTIKQAIEKASSQKDRPLIISDWTDVSGGGAPSDSTFILQALLENGIDNAAIAFLWDPLAVEIAHSAGTGAKLALRIGGKASFASGQPLDLMVEVKTCKKQFIEPCDGFEIGFGDVAVVSVQGIDILLSTLRQQPRTPYTFTGLGIDPGRKKVLVLKGMHHFRAYFGDIAGEIVNVDAGGLLTPDFLSISYKHILRPKWPFDKEPFKNR